MGRIKGAVDLSEIKREALIEFKKNGSLSNRQLVKVYNCDKNTIRNVFKRAEEAEKENINSLFLEIYQRRSQLGRFLTINDR